MGQGGTITIHNETDYNMHKEDSGYYQMKSWNFPLNIGPNQSERVYVEYEEAGVNRNDDTGWVRYAISDRTFVISIDWAQGFYVEFGDLSDFRIEPPNKKFGVGWQWNGNIDIYVKTKGR